MPLSLRLDDARTEVIYLAAIDGKNGANGRHAPARINAVLNRKYRALRTRVSQLGYPQFLIPGSATPIPAATANEDFIELPLGAGIAELGGVDVQQGTGKQWRRLDPISFGQRRDVGLALSNSDINAAEFMTPPSGVGFWAILRAPVPSGAAITAGTASIWPKNMTGNYKLFSVDAWTDITADANVFMLYEGWDEWLLNATAMAICTRDGNKRGTYEQAREAWAAADALVEAGAARLQRGGYFVPTSYGGIEI